jgi:hypothetical protein
MGATLSFESNDKYISGVMYNKYNYVVGYYTSDSDKNEYIPVYHKKVDFDGNDVPNPPIDTSRSIKFKSGWFLSGIFLSRVPSDVSESNVAETVEYHVTDGNTTMIGAVKSNDVWIDTKKQLVNKSQFTCGTKYINQINTNMPIGETPTYTGMCVAGDNKPIPIPLVPVVIPIELDPPEAHAFVYNPGTTGSDGIRGVRGWVGKTGSDGIRGPTGLPGVIGPTGISGVQGSPGGIGSQGPKGYQGPQGPTGTSGSTGPPGDQGIPGLKFGGKKYKYQLNAITLFTIILLIYILLWVSSVGSMIGITGSAPTSIGGALACIRG